MFNMKNPSFYWLDDETFILAFDGGIDEDGDEYSYLVRYDKGTGAFRFECWYEDYITPAMFSRDEEENIKTIMLKEIADQPEIRREELMRDASAEQCQREQGMQMQ